MIEIDGSQGEGGGQILRTSLSLSAITGQAVRITKIRHARKHPGLARQHRCAAQSLARICSGFLRGDDVGSQTLEFEPGPVHAGEHQFSVGTAGSCVLVLQTVLWPLVVRADRPSNLVIQGGTHNHMAPSFEFLAHSFVPAIAALGAKLEVYLSRHGFYPAGGGEIVAKIEPSKLEPIDLPTQGKLISTDARALMSNLPDSIGRRELASAMQELGWSSNCARVQKVESPGPGNALVLRAQMQRGCRVVTGLGRRGVRAETVGHEAALQMRAGLDPQICVGPHLADQLLIPMALAGGGSFYTSQATMHLQTNARVIERFLPIRVHIEDQGQRVRVRVTSPCDR